MTARTLALLVACLAWASTARAAGWEYVGQGDCPGRQVMGSAGESPEPERCTPEFAGKTALCFTQVCYPGCQYIDVPTRECAGGTELVHVYTCRPGPAAD